MSFDVNQAKIYRNAYRPSSNLSHFFKSLLSIIIIGNSTINSQPIYHSKKLK